MTGLRLLKRKSGKAQAWWACGSDPVIDPGVDEDWFGAHPGNLVPRITIDDKEAKREKQKQRLRRRLSEYHRPLWWKDLKKLTLIKQGKYKFTARETSEYAPQYEYDRHLHDYRYPYMQHIVDYYEYHIQRRKDHKDLLLKEEGKRRAQYLLYLKDAPDDHLAYDQWCVRGLLSP